MFFAALFSLDKTSTAAVSRPDTLHLNEGHPKPPPRTHTHRSGIIISSPLPWNNLSHPSFSSQCWPLLSQKQLITRSRSRLLAGALAGVAGNGGAAGALALGTAATGALGGRTLAAGADLLAGTVASLAGHCLCVVLAFWFLWIP